MKKLRWGETPFDTMKPHELKREAQRLFSALESARSVMKLCIREGDLFWSEEGSGGRALDRANQVIDPIYMKYDSESVYRSFYRYAISLLFKVPDKDKWHICSECGTMVSNPKENNEPCSKYPFGKKDCKGFYRLLEWKDLEPNNKKIA